MGTRSLTLVYDGNEAVVNMYRQYDGYPSGHGRELAEFLSPLTIVNGIGRETANIANGMGCLAAQLVAHFKDGVGQFYLHPVSAKDCGQDYEYHVYENRVVVKNYNGNEIFSGTWENFDKFCAAEEIA